MDKSIIELARFFKDSAKSVPTFEGFIVGKVISPPPAIQISIDEAIILDKSHLVIAAHVLNDYERKFEIEGEFQFTATDCGSTSANSSHSHSIESLNVDSKSLKAKGKLKWTDTLKKDELVILVPAGNQQMYILIDKAAEL
ncbi:DUF2577 domain-containing protein [Lysinibacillus sphaericus]|uniref:Nucleoside 2-deoxyribosyltransferase n=1 Tax=Lysinibacillus sphaericus OT4b.31 TaxID=1285586 RepID=R7Z8I4_LYSSH|nr:DUF2577 domain-containing protein [Lysinibacillus sphaericus]EON70452.1 nucleoside 2-deoxyribosyltransferase [Lysinibacillus sphaericus OT4b.31]